MYGFSHYDIKYANKVTQIIEVLKGSDLMDREFTKKEFDKVFKGITSLDWVRENGLTNDHKVGSYSKYPYSRKAIPFVTLVRVEDFELPFKNDNPYRKEMFVVYNENGEKVQNINAEKFSWDREYAEMCRKAYGNLVVDKEIEETFTAHRNYYKFNLDALLGVTLDREKAVEYLTERLDKARKEVEKCEKALALVG